MFGRFLKYLLFVQCIVVIGCSSGSSQQGPKNVILISIDTLRPDMMSCYGYERETSPFLDRLASQGVLFENAFATSPWTLPSHASLLTGTYPRRHGAITEKQAMTKSVRTLAEVLTKHRFSTAGFVNSFYLDDRYGFQRGFDHFESVPSEPGRKSSDMVGKALEWLSSEKPSRFFIFLHDYHVHSDYLSEFRYEGLFARPYSGSFTGSTEQLLEILSGKRSINESDAEHLIDLYVSGIRQVDAELEQLENALKQSGYWDNTLIIVTSDHGEEFLEHGSVLHARTQYDEVLRVPLILRGPGVPESLRISEPASLIDVMPTLLAILGIPSPTPLDGVDLSPALRPNGDGAIFDRILFGEGDQGNAAPDITRSARHKNFKLIMNRLTGATELYDLATDPGEKISVSQHHPEIEAILRKELIRFQANRQLGSELPELEPEVAKQLEALGYLR